MLTIVSGTILFIATLVVSIICVLYDDTALAAGLCFIVLFAMWTVACMVDSFAISNDMTVEIINGLCASFCVAPLVGLGCGILHDILGEIN